MTIQLTAQGNLPASVVNKNTGLVKYYDVPDKKWKYAMPVDVKEMLRKGTANLTGPMIEMIGPAGPVMVPSTQVGQKLGEGYTVKDAAEVATQLPPPDPQPQPDLDASGSDPGDSEDPEVYDFNKHTVDQLRTYAQVANIEGASRLNKADLIAALDEAGFDPRAAADPE